MFVFADFTPTRVDMNIFYSNIPVYTSHTVAHCTIFYIESATATVAGSINWIEKRLFC